MIDLTNRNELIELREAATLMITGTSNPTWVRVYEKLADAADALDAMQARCEIEFKENDFFN